MVITLRSAPSGALAWAVLDGDRPLRRFVSAAAAEQAAWSLTRARARAFAAVMAAPPPPAACPFTGAPEGC